MPTECPWRDTLYWYDTIDSTNTHAKEMAAAGAAHGTVLVAGHQTAGRGRMGRQFFSPTGKGLYLSVILRPKQLPQALLHLTCAVGVAACNAVEGAAGFRPGIKWINDLVVKGKKLGGILTEMSVHHGSISYAILGIGINCTHEAVDFPPELQGIATSLALENAHDPSPAKLAAQLIYQLWQTSCTLITKKAGIMAQYKADCITLGQDIVVLRDDEKRYGKAIDIDADGSLIVDFNGTAEAVSSGEVSIRGMYGYV